MRLAVLLALCLALGACVHERAAYTTTPDDRPLLLVERDNFMRIGQSITLVSIENGGEVTITKFSSEEAMSEELKQAWGELNKTGRYALIGAGIGAAAGQPAAGGIVGAAAAQVEKLLENGDDAGADTTCSAGDEGKGDDRP